MSPSRKHTVAVITACVAFVIFGFSFMFSSIALSIAPTTVLLCFRFTAAVLTLSLVVAANALVGRIRGKAWFSFSLRGKPLGGVLLLGLVQPVYTWCLKTAASAIPPPPSQARCWQWCR